MTNDVILATPEEVAAVRAKWRVAQPKRAPRNMPDAARNEMRRKQSEGAREAMKRHLAENDRWERIFNERFAAHGYYDRETARISSALSGEPIQKRTYRGHIKNKAT